MNADELRSLYADRANRVVAVDAPKLRLICVQLTACRTDLSRIAKPPRLDSSRFRHDEYLLEAFLVPCRDTPASAGFNGFSSFDF